MSGLEQVEGLYAHKTKKHLIGELETLRQRLSALERTEGDKREESTDQRLTDLKRIYQTAPIGLCYFDTKLRYVFINDWLAAINGMPVEEHLGRTVGEVLPDVAAGVESQLRHMIETGEPIVGGTVDAETPAHPGVIRNFEHNYYAIKSDDGAVVGVSCVVQEITERKRAEEALLLTQFAIEHASDAVYWLDRDGRIVYANNTVYSMLGYSRKELLGLSVPEYDLDATLEDFSRAFERIKKSGSSPFETRHRAKDGTIVPVEVSMYYLKHGEKELMACITRNITERKRAEEALRESEERFRAVVDNLPSAIFLKDKEGRYRLVNRRYEEWYGVTSHDIAGQTVYDRFSKERADAYTAEDAEVMESAQVVHRELQSRFPDGSNRTTLLARFPIIGPDGIAIGVGGVETDVSGQRQAEQRLRTIFADAPIGILVVDANGRFLDGNYAAQEMFGYSQKELQSLKFEDITYPEDIPKSLNVFEGMASGKRPRAQLEKRYVRKDGEVVWGRLTASSVRDTEGKVRFFIAMVEDVSEQKQAAERARQHEAELARVLRLSTMGEMASGLAHQLNQPLAAVVNYCRGCLRRLQSGEWKSDEIMNALEQACEQADRASTIVRDIRDFIRKSEPRRSLVDVNESVGSAVTLAEGELRNNRVRIRLNLADGLPPALVDAVEIEQVILNLLRNGMEAMMETEVRKRQLTICTLMAADRAIEVALQDTGPGLSPDIEDKIFEPFVSTKREGMGMGLAISRTIVEAHGGRLWATRIAGGGARFHFTLPADGGGPGEHA